MMKVWQPNSEELEQTRLWEIWEKEVSEFPWEYAVKETCYILKGKAVVTSSNGEIINFSAGDMVCFEKGLSCTWTIVEDIKKRYIFG